MEILKIVVTGAHGAGKTTLIQTISESEVVSTEPRPDDKLQIAMDFGQITAGGDAALHLFGTPGAHRFDPAVFAPMLSPRGWSGLVMVIDPSKPQAFAEARAVLGEVRRADRPYVIVVNRWDNANAVPTDAVREELRIEPGEAVHRCNARDREKVAAAIDDLLARMGEDEVIGTVRATLRAKTQ